MADVLAVRDDYRSQTWAMLIEECSNSGLTKREFCRRRGISEKSFYYWLRKLRSQMAEAAGPQIVQLESSVTSTEILQIQYRGADAVLPVVQRQKIVVNDRCGHVYFLLSCLCLQILTGDS